MGGYEHTTSYTAVPCSPTWTRTVYFVRLNPGNADQMLNTLNCTILQLRELEDTKVMTYFKRLATAARGLIPRMEAAGVFVFPVVAAEAQHAIFLFLLTS